MVKDYSHVKMNQAYVLGRTALKEGIPWITIEAFKALLKVVQPDWSVFEWGGGGSTTFFARECKSVITVEHNNLWIPRIEKMLAKEGLSSDLRYVRGGPKEDKDRFRKYANVILGEPDESFDLAYIDGEASSRGWTLTNAMPKLKPGGWLLIDNSDWVKRKFPGWEREDFIERDLDWPGQSHKFNWWTSILRKAG